MNAPLFNKLGALIGPFGIRNRYMAEPKPQSKETSPGTNSRTLLDSAIRTLEAEAGGVAALTAAIRNGLGAPFVAAIELIRSVRGRVIVTGMGKSGHVQPQDRRDVVVDRHARVLRASGRGRTW